LHEGKREGSCRLNSWVICREGKENPHFGEAEGEKGCERGDENRRLGTHILSVGGRKRGAGFFWIRKREGSNEPKERGGVLGRSRPDGEGEEKRGEICAAGNTLIERRGGGVAAFEDENCLKGKEARRRLYTKRFSSCRPRGKKGRRIKKRRTGALTVTR